MPGISLVVLTLNEEKNLSACLASASGFDDVHVLDSGSTDGTLSLAAAAGVAVHSHQFAGFGSQRNWAIDNIPTRHQWQLHLDADERLTPAGIEEMTMAIAGAGEVGGYRLPSKLMFCGRWMRRVGDYPTYQVRLFHKQRLRFENYGHGQREVSDYPIATLREPYLHLAFSHGLDRWFAKHIGYARREAEQAIADQLSPFHLKHLFSPDRTVRRRALKRLAYRVPCRYLVRLMYLLILKGGILDGPEGITYAHMLATYEGMMEVFIRQLSRGVES
jgi:glycosyltransferase involved in cell wall biosynthesis